MIDLWLIIHYLKSAISGIFKELWLIIELLNPAISSTFEGVMADYKTVTILIKEIILLIVNTL